MGFDYNSPLVKMVPKDTTEEQRENSKHQLRNKHDYRSGVLFSSFFFLFAKMLQKYALSVPLTQCLKIFKKVSFLIRQQFSIFLENETIFRTFKQCDTGVSHVIQ